VRKRLISFNFTEGSFPANTAEENQDRKAVDTQATMVHVKYGTDVSHVTYGLLLKEQNQEPMQPQRRRHQRH